MENPIKMDDLGVPLFLAIGNGPFEDVFPIKMVIFHCHVSLPEGTFLFLLAGKKTEQNPNSNSFRHRMNPKILTCHLCVPIKGL